MAVIDVKTYAAARKYTKDTVEGAGAIKGKNCVVDSIVDITGGHRVTFKWTLDSGTVQTGYMDVMDGVDGEDGANGVGVSSADINDNNHLIITYTNGQTHDAGQIKVEGQTIQRNVLPEASEEEAGKIYQYIGADTPDLVNGYFYQCVADGAGYKWEEKTVQRAGGSITVDTELDPTSHNAVENMAIAVPIQALQGSMANVKLNITQLQASDLSLRTAIHDLDLLVASKVDKEAGKGLSTEDFTTNEKNKLDNLAEIKQIGTGLSLNPATGELEATGVAIEIDPTLDPTSAHAIQNQAVAIPISALQGSMAGVKLDISALQGSLAGKADSSDLGTAAYKDVPVSGDASAAEVVMGNDSRLTDARNAADVQAWAKAANKPTYTATEVGAVATTAVGSANGVAPLGSDQKVPAANLPSYVDDVEEYSSQSLFPATGESGKIYVDTSTNKTYRWSGTTYVVIGGDLALGETASTAYAGNKGKANADAIAAIKDGASIDSFSDVETALGNKQDTISDLSTIRSGASAGATAYQKPSGGIPKSDMAIDVQTSLGKADTAIQSHQDISGKADKVSGAVANNFAGLDANGNLKDSGKSALDFLYGSIIPTPAPTITDAALKLAINGAGSNEDKVPTGYAMRKWSNSVTKRYIVSGATHIGTTGIGTWYDGDAADLDPTTDEVDWIEISDLIGIESADDIDIDIKYDPSSGEPIVKGGYEIDTTTGKMCIKFANEIATPANAKVAIDITFLRNEYSTIS